jgi:hypothetical protein
MVNVLLTPLARVPDRVIAGDSIVVRADGLMAAYDSAEGYSVTWLFQPAAGGEITSIAGVADADAWKLAVPASVSAAWVTGRWRWSVRVVNDDFAQTIDQGMMTVDPNPATADIDSRSQSQRILDLVNAAIEGRASSSDLEFEFEDGRRLRKMTHAEMLALRDRYAKIVAAEANKARRTGPGRVLASL